MKGTVEVINKRTGKMECKICGRPYFVDSSNSIKANKAELKKNDEVNWICKNGCEENDFSMKLCLKELQKFPSKRLIQNFYKCYVAEIKRIGNKYKRYQTDYDLFLTLKL